MKFDPNKHHRRSIRLPGYDYTEGGWYFVTLVTRDRKCLFDDALMRGVAETLWQQMPGHFRQLSLDESIVMPNHLHGIIVLAWANRSQPSAAGPGPKLPAGSLGAVIANFKSMSTRRLNQLRGLTGRQVWQRDYYERVIRSEEELRATRQYIRDNPARWALDEYFAAQR